MQAETFHILVHMCVNAIDGVNIPQACDGLCLFSFVYFWSVKVWLRVRDSQGPLDRRPVENG